MSPGIADTHGASGHKDTICSCFCSKPAIPLPQSVPSKKGAQTQLKWRSQLFALK